MGFPAEQLSAGDGRLFSHVNLEGQKKAGHRAGGARGRLENASAEGGHRGGEGEHVRKSGASGGRLVGDFPGNWLAQVGPVDVVAQRFAAHRARGRLFDLDTRPNVRAALARFPKSNRLVADAHGPGHGRFAPEEDDGFVDCCHARNSTLVESKKSTHVFAPTSTGVYSAMMTLGSNIKHHRTHLGLTLAQLSELSGVEVGTISALENRNSKRSEHASAIARALGLTVEELESGSKAAKITTSSDIGKLRAAEERAPWLRDENERLLIDGYRVASPGLRQAMTALAREAVNTFSKRIGNGN